MLVCVFMCSLHTRPRVQRAPGLPCALSLRANEFAKLGRSEPRDREAIFSRHHPRKRVNQYSEAAVIEPRGRGVLDTPLSRGTTAAFGASLSLPSLRAKRSNPESHKEVRMLPP